MPAYFGGLDQCFHQGAAGCASDSLAPLGGQALTLLFSLSRRFTVADFGLLFGQQAQQNLPPRLVGFDGEKPPVVLDIHMGDGSVHSVVPSLVVYPTLFLRGNYTTRPRSDIEPCFQGLLTLMPPGQPSRRESTQSGRVRLRPQLSARIFGHCNQDAKRH